MKKSKLILAAICTLFAMALVVGCNNAASGNNDSSDDNTTQTGDDNTGGGSGSGGESSVTSLSGLTYRGTMTHSESSETVYIDFIFTDGTNWRSQGYTDNTFTTTSQVGTTTGTYTISGNTGTINMPLFNATLIGTTSDNWETLVFSGVELLFTGTLRKL